jgi:signal transduction histidine kinase
MPPFEHGFPLCGGVHSSTGGERFVADDRRGEASVFPAAVRRAAADSFRRRLQADDSPLTKNAEATAQLLHQTESVLDDVEAASRGEPSTDEFAARLSEQIGTSRAFRGVHPMASVGAANHLFDVLLPVVLERLRARDAGEPVQLRATTALHRSIMRRFGLGAVAYASFLRRKVNSSHREERARIARELHDRVAHGVGTAIQDLELFSVYADRDLPRARTRIDTAGVALAEALDTVRQLAQELRDSVAEVGGLGTALSDYVAVRVPSSIQASTSVSGMDQVPPEVTEELYIVLREAIRNVVLHAKASTVTVDVSAVGGDIHATVRDDGQGFDVAAAQSARGGIGLSSMRERVELLDGTLSIVAERDGGTAIAIVVPHPERHA